MPTYDYRCKACGSAHEFFQSMSERPKRKCPACGALKLERQIGAGAGILFKGSGFYETDYRSKDYQQASKAEAGGADGSSGDSSAKKGSGDAPAASSPEQKTPAKGDPKKSSKDD